MVLDTESLLITPSGAPTEELLRRSSGQYDIEVAWCVRLSRQGLRCLTESPPSAVGRSSSPPATAFLTTVVPSPYTGAAAPQRSYGLLERCVRLRYLDLSCNELTSLQAIECLSATLVYLNVSCNHLTDLGPLGTCSSLVVLHAARNRLRDRAAVLPIASRSALPSLTTLTLRGAHPRVPLCSTSSSTEVNAGEYDEYPENPLCVDGKQYASMVHELFAFVRCVDGEYVCCGRGSPSTGRLLREAEEYAGRMRQLAESDGNQDDAVSWLKGSDIKAGGLPGDPSGSEVESQFAAMHRQCRSSCEVALGARHDSRPSTTSASGA